MAELKRYTVSIGGIEHTVQLSADDAKKRDAKPVETATGKDAPRPKK